MERCSSYTIAHGEAVAIGMALACRAAERMGCTPRGTTDTVRALLRRYGLPDACPFDADALFDAVKVDKKRTGDGIDFVVLEEIGRAKVLRLTMEQMREWTEAAL